MAYRGESSNEAQERLQREREAVAFLSSLGPQFEMARSVSPGLGRKTQPRTVGSGAVNGHGIAVNGAGQRPVAQQSVGGKSAPVASVVTVSRESEEKRQEALRRLKATHCSVNHEKVNTVYYYVSVL